MGFGPDLGFQEAGVNASDLFVSFQGMDEGRPGEKLGSTKALGRYSKAYLGSFRAQGSQQLGEDKSWDPWEMHLFLCFAGSWRPQMRSWVAGQTASSTLNPRNWMNKYTKKMSAEGNRCTTSVGPGEKHLPDGRHGLGGEATTQKQYLRSPLSLKTTQDLKHLNKTN